MNLFHEAKKVLDKDGKVNALGPYGKQKLTGREIQTYFRRNKVKDKTIRKAVEVALDLGGAMDIAIKAIKDYYGNKILKAKEVQYALKFANEENFKDSFELLDENYKDIIKMYPRDRDWKKIVMKHRRHLDDFQKGKKDLSTKVEDELISWALDNGEVSHKGEVEDFIDQVLNASYEPKGNSLSEGKNLMPDIQKIVDTKGAKKVGGIMIDMFTASMINQIYNKVNDKNKQKMEKSNINTLVDLAQRMMQKMGDNIAEEVKTTLSEAPYDDKDVKNVQKLQKKLEKMLKEVDKTMRGSGLSAPAFSMVRGGIRKGLEQIEKFYKVAAKIPMKEEVNLQEGTWAVPDSYPKLVKLQKILNKKNIAKDAKTVFNFTEMIYDIFGDDSFFDRLGVLEVISKGGERDQYDGEKRSEDYIKKAHEYAKKNGLKAGMDMNELLKKYLSDWTGGDMKFKGSKIVQMPREWYFKDNPEHSPDNAPVKATLNAGDNVQEKFRGFDKLPRGRMKRPRGGSIKAEAVSRAQQAAIAISKKEKAGKPGYDKKGKSLKKETVMDSYRKMWESENLEEKKEFKQSDIDKVAKLTDRNEHTKSLIHIAKTMGDKNSFKKLQLIDKMHNEYGHMPKGLMDMRNEVYDDLKKGMEKYSNGKDMYGAT